MRSRFWGVLAVTLLAATTVACGKGKECDTCGSDDDCDVGLICDRFEGGRSACADDSTLFCTFTD